MISSKLKKRGKKVMTTKPHRRHPVTYTLEDIASKLMYQNLAIKADVAQINLQIEQTRKETEQLRHDLTLKIEQIRANLAIGIEKNRRI